MKHALKSSVNITENAVTSYDPIHSYAETAREEKMDPKQKAVTVGGS